MRTADWQREYLGTPFHPAPKGGAYRNAISLWCWYYTTTEDFDRTVCPFRKDGVAWPVTPYERALCTRYAALQMKVLQRSAERQRIDRTTLESARHVARDLSYDDQKSWLDAHGGAPSWSADYEPSSRR